MFANPYFCWIFSERNPSDMHSRPELHNLVRDLTGHEPESIPEIVALAFKAVGEAVTRAVELPEKVAHQLQELKNEPKKFHSKRSKPNKLVRKNAKAHTLR